MTEHTTKITETSRYAEQVIAHSVVTSKSRRRRWIATTATKMKKFLGILFTMGLVKKACVGYFFFSRDFQFWLATLLTQVARLRNYISLF